MSDRDKTIVQGTAIGTVGGIIAGGGVGYGVGKAAGLKDRDAAALAIVGAVIGGLVGSDWGKAWGESVVNEKEAYANMEDYLRANIRQSNQRIRDLNSTNEGLAKSIQSIKQQRAELARAQNQAQKKEFNNSIAQITQAINCREKLVNKDIKNGREAIRLAKKEGASPQEITRLEKGVRTMEGQLATMSNNRKAIARLKL